MENETLTDLRKARFTASRIGELLAGGSGKTRQSYILDLALQSIGIKDEFQTKENIHGIISQRTAFEQVVLKEYDEATWFDV